MTPTTPTAEHEHLRARLQHAALRADAMAARTQLDLMKLREMEYRANLTPELARVPAARIARAITTKSKQAAHFQSRANRLYAALDACDANPRCTDVPRLYCANTTPWLLPLHLRRAMRRARFIATMAAARQARQDAKDARDAAVVA